MSAHQAEAAEATEAKYTSIKNDLNPGVGGTPGGSTLFGGWPRTGPSTQAETWAAKKAEKRAQYKRDHPVPEYTTGKSAKQLVWEAAQSLGQVDRVTAAMDNAEFLVVEFGPTKAEKIWYYKDMVESWKAARTMQAVCVQTINGADLRPSTYNSLQRYKLETPTRADNKGWHGPFAAGVAVGVVATLAVMYIT